MFISATNLKFKKDQFSRQSSIMRPVAYVTELDVRSQFECAAKCSHDYYCMAANFSPTSGSLTEAGTCRLFHDVSNGTDLISDSNWTYLTVMS